MFRQIMKIVIPVLIYTMAILIFMDSISPFKTKEQKQVKEMYQDSFRYIHTFKLKSVDTDIHNSCLRFRIILKTNKNKNLFNQDELVEMNLAVDRMLQYLNEKDDFNRKYETIQLYFYPGSGKFPDGILCSINDVHQKYVFDGLYSDSCNGLFDLYMMKDVTSITLNTGITEQYSYEKISRFSELENLREICYTHVTDIDYLKSLKKGLQTVLPECKLYADGVEVTLERK